MTHNQNPNDVFNNPKKKMIRKPVKICPANISPSH